MRRITAVVASGASLTLGIACIALARQIDTGRYIGDRQVASHSIAGGTFTIGDRLDFLGQTAVTLRDRADAEILLFADSGDVRVDRFFQFQFESLRPETEGTITHDAMGAVEIGGVEFELAYWCFDLQEAADERPDSDIAVVRGLFAEAGVGVSGTYAGLRFVRLSDDKRSEILIIYGERVSLRGLDCQDEESALPILLEMQEDALAELSFAPKADAASD